MFGKKKEPNFKFNLGDKVRDMITDFSGIITCRSQWLHNCNTYGGIKSKELKDRKPMDNQFFDEPSLKIIEEKVHEPKQKTGGLCQSVNQTNR